MKKNNCTQGRATSFPRWKIFLTMKLLALFLLGFILQTYANEIQAQSKLNLQFDNLNLKQVFQQLESNSDYSFIYQDNIISTNKISGNFNDQTVTDFLDNILQNTGLTYTVKGHTIIILQDGSSPVAQPEKVVSGVVTDNTGFPMPGVTVAVKGTTNGTITNGTGNYSISKVQQNDILQFSFVGMKTQEIAVGTQSVINVVLEEETVGIEEVVAVGYGTMKKSDLTGAISSVKGDEIANRLQSNPAEALTGLVSGVNIMRQGGNAGSGIDIKIRGVSTFADNEPYCLVDGFPMNLDNVNPSDIETMEILKDGAAAAIYGSRAANGVILITTKNGKKGDVSIDVNAFAGIASVANGLDMLDAEGYKKVHSQMYQNAGKALPAYVSASGQADTDWFDTMTRNAVNQNYSVGVRGGSENSKYSISYTRSDEEGILLGNRYVQDNARARYSFTKKIFTVDSNLGLQFVDNQQPQYSLKEIYAVSPLVPIYDSSEEEGYGLTNKNDLPANHNVMADYENVKVKNKDYIMSANVSLGIKLCSSVNFKSTYGYRGSFNKNSYHTPSYTPSIQDKVLYPENSESNTYWQEQIQENVLTFAKEFNRHDLTVMVGNSINATYSDWHTVSVDGSTGGFLDPNSETIDAGVGGSFSGEGSNFEYNRASFFGRLNYVFDRKYLIQVTARRDGSSKFGADRRWGFFPSVAAGWTISQEEFFPKDGIFNNLKFRASWGRLGNESALGYYDFQTLVTTVNRKSQGYVQGDEKTPWAGSISTGMANNDLQWETTESKNIGFDYGMFDNRLTGSVNYYNSTTSDLLITKVLAPSAGLDDPTLNVGKIRNSGIEFDAKWIEKKGDLGYTIGVNLTTTTNEVLQLANANQILYGTGLKYGDAHFPTQTRVGEPIGAFYLYQMDGIFQSEAEVQNHVSTVNGQQVVIQPDAAPGDIRFKDINGDGMLTSEDMIYSGSGIPKVEINLLLAANWKGFDFSATIGSAWGAKIYNGTKYFYEAMSSGSNFLTSTLNAWTESNHSNSIPRAVLSDPNGNTRESTRFLENGNFVKLRQIQVGYTIPAYMTKKLGLDRLRVYCSANNLLTITNYSGIDPEFSRSSVLNTGVDNYIFPFTKSYLAGIQLSF